MKVAAPWDVHGMLDALEAVLAEVPDDAAIVLGGDCIQGPQLVETLERLRALVDGNVELRRTRYDLDAAVAALRSTVRPEGEHWVKRLGGA